MSRIVLNIEAHENYPNTENIEKDFSNFTLDMLEYYAGNDRCLFRDVAIKVLNKSGYHLAKIDKIIKDLDELINMTFKQFCKNSLLDTKMNILNKHFHYPPEDKKDLVILPKWLIIK